MRTRLVQRTTRTRRVAPADVRPSIGRWAHPATHGVELASARLGRDGQWWATAPSEHCPDPLRSATVNTWFFRYHIQALSQDVETGDYIFGAANVGVARREHARRKDQGLVDPELEDALDVLEAYFGRSANSFTVEERGLAERQNVAGEVLSATEGQVLENAQRRVAETASLSKAEAGRRVETVQRRTRSWAE